MSSSQDVGELSISSAGQERTAAVVAVECLRLNELDVGSTEFWQLIL